MTDADLRRILTRVTSIACLGVSANPVRPSHYVARYLSRRGYRVHPVNPGLAGETLFGREVVGGLADLPGDVQMLDVFRRSEHVPAIVEEALGTMPSLEVIWLQIGIVHEQAAETARARGIEVVMDRCPKIEHQRLFGELRMGGFATGIISSKLS